MRLRDTRVLVGLGALVALLSLAASPALALPLAGGLEDACAFDGCDITYWDPEDGGNGHYYAFVPAAATPPTWTEARDLAAGGSLGAGSIAHLVTIEDAAENAFIKGQVLPLGFTHKRQVWLGGFQNDTPVKSLPPEAGWQWITPEGWSYTNWAPGEPNDENATHTGDERYLAMWVHFYVEGVNYRGTWNDEGLESQAQGPIVGFLVEFEARGAPVPEASVLLLALLGSSVLARRKRA